MICKFILTNFSENFKIHKISQISQIFILNYLGQTQLKI